MNNKIILLIAFLILILSLGAVAYFVLSKDIEVVYHTKISVDKLDSSKIYISPNDAYKFKVDDLIFFNFDGHSKNGVITGISYDAEMKSYYAEIYSKDFSLINGSVADVFLISEKSNLFKVITGSV